MDFLYKLKHAEMRYKEMDQQLLMTIIGGLLGGGIIGFIEFVIRRNDERKDKNKEVIQAIEKLDKKVDDRFNTLDQKIELVDKKGDERNAISSRIRILRFADEMMENRKHSKDSWSQALVDCDTYEDYCKDNEDFRNNITSATISYLKSNYAERLEKHDFL